MNRLFFRSFGSLGLALAVAGTSPSLSQTQNATTFVNPLRTDIGADPWIAQRDGFYYFTATSGNEVMIARAKTLEELARAPLATVWKRPEKGRNARDIWAPELHFLKGKWWVYYTATSDDGNDNNRRVFCLESQSDDALGQYVDRGQIQIPNADFYAIDGTVFQKQDGSLYFLWSGREGAVGSAQNVFICAMSDPHTLTGPRVKLSSPTFDWERIGWEVNEGPEVLEHNGQVFVIYSASGGTTPDYSLGMLWNPTGNLLDAKAWTKSPIPVFSRYSGPDGNTFTPGHNGFFKSPDGKEDWIVFHGKESIDNSWGGRLARAQKFTWNPNGTPNFGFPVPASIRLNVPGGEVGSTPQKSLGGTGLRAQYFAIQGNTPSFDTALGTEHGQNVDFDWNVNAPLKGVPADRFSVRWTGQIQPRTSGLYTFQTFADDGIRVTIDEKEVINDFRPGLARATRGFVFLEAGRKYPIRVEYFEVDGGARASLYWQSETQAFEPVPRDCLFPPTN